MAEEPHKKWIRVPIVDELADGTVIQGDGAMEVEETDEEETPPTEQPE